MKKVKIFLNCGLELVTAMVMSIPIETLRWLYVKLLCKKMGKHCVIMRHIRLNAPWRIEIGSDVVINRNVVLDGRRGLVIQDSCDIGEYVKLWSLEHDINTHENKGDITVIEDHCWIAPYSIILPGVRIGQGSVIATGTIVTKNISPLCVVAGIPGKEIGKRSCDLSYKINYKTFF